MPNTFHIAFVAPYASTYLLSENEEHPGGAERQQYLIAKNLVEKGHTVSFITYEAESGPRELDDGIKISPIIPKPASISNIPAIVRALYKSMKDHNADVYYFRGTQKLCALAGSVCTVLRKPYVYHVANDADVGPERFDRYPALVRYWFRAVLKRADAVVAQKETQAVLLKKNYNVRAVTIPNIYTIPYEDQVPAASDREVCLWVGRLDPEQKHPERYLDLASQIPEFRCIMIGKGKDEEYHEFIHSRAAELPNVEHIEYVPPDEIDEYYRKAIAFINTSAYEGFPNTFLEAWRFATPVISLNPVLEGLIEEEGLGYSDLQIEDAIQHIRTLRSNPDIVENIGSTGRCYVVRNHSVENCLDDYEKLFLEATI